MPKRRGRIQIQAREGTAATKHDQIRAREEASVATKHLHAIPTAGESFYSKISKRGWWRREIEWEGARAAPVARKGTGHGEEEWGERSNRGYIYPRKFVLPDYRPEGTGTTGEVDSRRQPTRGNELPVVPVVDRYYRSPVGTNGGSSTTKDKRELVNIYDELESSQTCLDFITTSQNYEHA
jgi:hypothetical protein